MLHLLQNSDWVKRLGRVVATLEDGLLVLILASMIGLAGTQILLRNLFDSGIAWIDPLLRVLVLWLGMLGAMAATRDDHHIRIDVVSRFLNPRQKNVALAVTSLFSAIVCGVIAWYGARFVSMEWGDETVVFAAVPAWLTELIIPVGFGMMAVRSLLLFSSCLFAMRQHRL